MTYLTHTPPVPQIDHRGEKISPSIRLFMLSRSTYRYEDHPLGVFRGRTRMELLKILDQLPELSKSDGQLDIFSQKVMDAGYDATRVIYSVGELIGKMRLHQLYEEVKI